MNANVRQSDMNTRSAPRTILVLHLAGITRVLLALPALRALRQHFGEARIAVVTGSSCADLVEMAQCADEALPMGRFQGAELLGPRAFYRSLGSIGQLRRQHFDLAIDLTPNVESEFLMRLALPVSRMVERAATRGGLAPLMERFRRLLNPAPALTFHQSHQYLKMLEPLGVRPVEAEPRLTTDPVSDEKIEKLLRKHGAQAGELLIGVHPGADHLLGRWPVERFTSIASRLIHNFNARVLVFAGPSERGMAKKMTAALPAKRAIALESPSIRDFVSASARLSLLVANHAAPAHLAAAVRTPVLAASVSTGSTPWDVLGTNVVHVRAPHAELIAEDEIYEAACRLLKINRAEFLWRR